MTPEQRARLEVVAAKASTAVQTYWLPGDDDLFPAIAAALAHIDALEQKVADAEARERQSQDNESIYVLSRDYDALAAERDALREYIKPTNGEPEYVPGHIAIQMRELRARAEQAERERDEAEAKWEQCCEVLESIAQEKAQAERTAAALQRRVTALEAAMNPQDVADVDATLAPTKEEA